MYESRQRIDFWSSPIAGNGVAPFLEHADRWWKAEEANAARISTRFGFLQTAITAVLGLRFSFVTKEIEYVMAWPFLPAQYLYITVAGVSLFFFFYALAATIDVVSPRRFQSGDWLREIWIRRPRPKQVKNAASSTMRLPQEADQNPGGASKEQAQFLAFRLTYGAASDLSLRNAGREFDLGQAQRALLLGTLLLVLLAIVFVIMFKCYGGPLEQPQRICR